MRDLKQQLINTYKSIGKINYGATKSEKSYLKFKRSIYASKNIKKGEKFNKFNIKVVRPGFGLEPKYFSFLLGKKAAKEIKFASPIKLKNVKK